MIAALLLTTLLAAGEAQPAQRPTPDQAIELVRQKNWPAALDAFRQMAAENPRNIEARLWIGRMHAEMGHPELAEPVFRSVMMESPQNVDARLGLGNALMELRAYDEAVVVLEPAAKADPNNQDVAAALRRAHGFPWMPRFLRF